VADRGLINEDFSRKQQAKIFLIFTIILFKINYLEIVNICTDSVTWGELRPKLFAWHADAFRKHGIGNMNTFPLSTDFFLTGGSKSFTFNVNSSILFHKIID